MKIFHIISHFDLGGAERVAINICKSQNNNFTYHIVEVVRGNSEFTLQMLNELEEHKIQYHRSPITSNKLGIILFPIWFFILYLKHRPTIIHTHTEIPDLSIYLFHFIYPWHKRYVRTIHNTELWNKWKAIGKKVESFYQKRKANVSISLATQQEYLKAYGDSNIPIIYNGIEITSQQEFPYLHPDKINVLFAGRMEHQKGVTEMVRTQDNAEGIDQTIAYTQKEFDGLCFVNLVDFDMKYGHRNDIPGYAKALSYFDKRLPEIMEGLREDDILMITADHGCDPSTPSTDHSREYTPLVIFGKHIKPVNLGTKKGFGNIAATILDYLNVEGDVEGESFWNEIKK